MIVHFLQPCLKNPDGLWGLHNLTTGTPIAANLIRAFDRASRNAGLLRRDGLPLDAAIVLAPCSSIHTWFMRFPIDVLFLGKTGRVLAVRRSLPPWRFALRFGAFAAIEVMAGSARSIEVGHVLAPMLTTPASEGGRVGAV